MVTLNNFKELGAVTISNIISIAQNTLLEMVTAPCASIDPVEPLWPIEQLWLIHIWYSSSLVLLVEDMAVTILLRKL